MSDLGVCDFCSAPDPVWCFPTRDFLTGAMSPDGSVHYSAGGWCACELCKVLVEEGKEAVLRDAVNRYISKNPGTPRAPIDQALRQLYDRFFAHRDGPPVRLREFMAECEHKDLLFSEHGKGSWFLPTGFYCARCGQAMVVDPEAEEVPS